MELALDVHRTLGGPRSVSLVSILVFVELALDAPPNRASSEHLMSFQSLFSWNLLLMGIKEVDSGTGVAVSILVFVELALDASFPLRPVIRGRVSILVFVELALDVSPGVEGLLLQITVSILVFVELALDDCG